MCHLPGGDYHKSSEFTLFCFVCVGKYLVASSEAHSFLCPYTVVGRFQMLQRRLSIEENYILIKHGHCQRGQKSKRNMQSLPC